MAVSQAYVFLWATGIVFVILPHLNMGLLSDYKICGDSECESLMSRVQAIRDHHGKDCRFLSFRQGDTIFVYHKLTGKREDLWAGSIDKQFGYFPKAAVTEEQVYVTTEKKVETQESDFFCMDESGYLIDSSHLDTGNDDDSDQKISIQESETTQTDLYTDGTNAGSPSISEDASAESPASAQEADGASTEENKNKNDADDAAGTHEEKHKTPAALNEQGGSPSSSWFSSSVTGWLGGTKEEEPDNLAEGVKNDEIKQTQAKDSFTSSVTGWLGLGGEGKPDDAKDSIKGEEEEETTDSFTSTMTGWLGFGGEKKTKEVHNEEIEPTEKFRSRKLSLDLEANQLQGEEKEEMGTLGWLGNGLSSTLGFGLTNQESGDKTTAGRKEAEETSQEEEEQPASSSWMDLGITDILGFRKDKNDADETTRSGFQNTEEDKTDSQNVDTGQSQPALTDEAKTETSIERLEEKVATKTETVLEAQDDSIISSSNKDTTETQQDQYLPSESETQSGNTVSVDADSNGKLEEKSQAASSMLDSFSQKCSEEEEEGKILDDNMNEKNVANEEKETEVEGEAHQTLESVGREPGEEMKTASDIDQDYVPQNDVTSGSVFRSDDLKSNSTGQSVSEAVEEETQRANEEEAEMTKQIDNVEESTEMSVKIGASGNEETDVLHREIPTTPSDESAEQSHVRGGAEDVSDFEKDFNESETEAETEKEEKQETEELQEGEAQEELKEVEKIKEEEKQDDLQEEEGMKEEKKKEELKKVEGMKEEEKQDDLQEEEGMKEEEKQEELKEVEGMKEVEKQEELKEVEGMKEEEKQEELKEVEGMKEEEKQEEIKEVEGMKEEEKQEELKEVEGMKEEMKQEETEELKEQENRKEVEELKKDEKWEEVKESKEEMIQEEGVGLPEKEKQQEVEEIKEERKKKGVEDQEFKEEEKKEEVEEKKQDVVDELREEEKQERVEEVKEEKNMDMVKGLNDNDLESAFTPSAKKIEKIQTESFQAEEERREVELKKEEKQEAEEGVKEEEKREVGVKQQAKDAEDEARSKEEEESHNQSVQGERSTAYERTKQTGQHDSVQVLSAGTEERDRIQEAEKINNEMKENRQDDSGRGEVGGTKNSLENEHTGSNSANVISDLNLKVDQKGEVERTDNEVPHSRENHHRLPDESSTKNTDLCDDTSTPETITEQIHSEDHSRETVGDESRGAFGFFKNPFSFFSETPITEMKESTEAAPSLVTNTGETPPPQASVTPEQKADSTTASSQIYIEDLQPDSPAVAQVQPSPSSPSSLTLTPTHPSTLSPNTEAPLKTKPPSKHHNTLLAQMSTDEMTVLVELFGRHKLQFLDYILGRSVPVTEDPDDDDDESILLDIETLLHHHKQTLFPPSMRLTDAAQENKEKTKTLIALEKLEVLLKRVRETFNTGKSDISKPNHQAEASCVGASCSSKHGRDREMSTGDESRKTGDSSVGLDDNIRRDEGMEEEKERDGELSGGRGEEKDTEKRGGVMKQILDFVHQIAEDSSAHVCAVRDLLIWLVQVVSSLPDDIRPGPDLYGVPWEPVIISSLVGLVTMLLFSCRCYSSVKSRMYRSKERRLAEHVAQLLDEKCKVLETLSKCQQEYDELENSLMDNGVLAQIQKTEHLEVKARQLEHAKRELEKDRDQLKDQLDQQREHRIEQEKRIAVLEESIKTYEEETKDLQSQEEQAQTTLKVYNMNSDRLQRNLETAGEENTLLQESNAQLRQQVEGWAERVSELEEEMRRCEVAHSGMVQDVANKDERIMSLTDRLLRMKAWDSELEEEQGGEGGEETSNWTAGKREENGRGEDSQGHLQKVQKLIYAAKLNADLKSVDEDKDRVFAKLNDEVKAKEDLEVSIKELENEKLSLQSDSEGYSDQVQRLQQKLNIMTEMYQENELKLHRLLTVEEKERLQKEEKLNKADKNIALAMEELHNYRHRAEEMEEELDKTKQSYQTQISAHEKKAHNNWLAARAADRELSDIRRENALLRQKLTDTQFKLDALDKDPYALDSLARPLPFRAERSPYGPSPLGRPASETRAFLSPPTLMEGPPARLSPRVSRGPMEPPGGHGEMERSGGPHSDSGSISPTWERDRRGPPPGHPGPLGPPGYMFPEPGGPVYRRPVPPPGAMGILPPPGSLPLGPPLPHPRGLPGPPHPADMADGAYRENSLGPEQDHRESGPTERRTPPEADPRMGGVPPPGAPIGPMDGPFPRRPPYGPPPPDFYPPRGPGGPPMMPRWAPPPPGMMFPPRFPPGGPPHPHMPPYGPPMRPPPPDGLPPPSTGPPLSQQPLPSPPHGQSPEEHTPSPQDVI